MKISFNICDHTSNLRTYQEKFILNSFISYFQDSLGLYELQDFHDSHKNEQILWFCLMANFDLTVKIKAIKQNEMI